MPYFSRSYWYWYLYVVSLCLLHFYLLLPKKFEGNHGLYSRINSIFSTLQKCVRFTSLLISVSFNVGDWLVVHSITQEVSAVIVVFISIFNFVGFSFDSLTFRLTDITEKILLTFVWKVSEKCFTPPISKGTINLPLPHRRILVSARRWDKRFRNTFIYVDFMFTIQHSELFSFKLITFLWYPVLVSNVGYMRYKIS